MSIELTVEGGRPENVIECEIINLAHCNEIIIIIIIIIIITSTSDLQPSTAIANQLPSQ